MTWFKHQSRQENLIYLALWATLFVAPVLSMYIHSVSDSHYTLQWSDLWIIWPKFLIYLALFLVHNFLLAPVLIYQHKRGRYALLTLSMVAVFTLFQCTNKPQQAHGPFHKEHRMEHPHMRHPHMRHPHGAPPAIIGEHDIVAVVILVLMLGMNIGIKGFFRSRKDREQLVKLEKENLEQQLEYLKYQINPHFFMNTLNNIHALVDIDPEKAKETILELSKMMRFILYEGDKYGVPLSREFDFIRNYLTLMRLRYTDKVLVTADLPAEVPDRSIPPLMLISFIENAFKHGISYQHDSFIDIRASVDNRQLHFVCRNSKAEHSNQEKGGVGLANVRKRLQLLYGNRFTLHLVDAESTYQVVLTIPLEPLK